jgi:hypothetical protein
LTLKPLAPRPQSSDLSYTIRRSPSRDFAPFELVERSEVLRAEVHREHAIEQPRVVELDDHAPTLVRVVAIGSLAEDRTDPILLRHDWEIQAEQVQVAFRDHTGNDTTWHPATLVANSLPGG